jgi:hypothetical protein
VRLTEARGSPTVATEWAVRTLLLLGQNLAP